MKNPILLRHGIVEHPFTDYNNVKFEEFIDLAMGTIDPGIDWNMTDKILNNTIKKNPEINNSQIIITSPMKRCIETATMLRQKINKKIPIIQFQELVEVFRKPQDFSDEQSYYEKGVYHYREKLIEDMFDNRYSDTENIQNIYTRLINIFDYIGKNFANQNLCIVYHAYPLKYTDFFVDNQISFGNFSLQNILDHKPIINKGTRLPLKHNIREYVDNEIKNNKHIFNKKCKIQKLKIH